MAGVLEAAWAGSSPEHCSRRAIALASAKEARKARHLSESILPEPGANGVACIVTS
jgi:hypothetical protein